MSRKIVITKLDKKRLQKLINDIIQHNYEGKEHVKALETELNRAKVVAPDQIPHDIITMNSKVLLSIGESEEEIIYSLVYPEKADFLDKQISILAPIGTALLGYKVGDLIKWKVPSGTVMIRVKKILYQPEFAKDFDL